MSAKVTCEVNPNEQRGLSSCCAKVNPNEKRELSSCWDVPLFPSPEYQCKMEYDPVKLWEELAYAVWDWAAADLFIKPPDSDEVSPRQSLA